MNEWEHEPDRVEFEYLGFKCLILRHLELKHLCGYIALPPGHPYYGRYYNDIPVKVHGGLTFAREGDGERRARGYWWLGFDCAHSNDYVPFLGPPRRYLKYRNIQYVTNELIKLARQLTPEGMLEKHLEVNNG